MLTTFSGTVGGQVRQVSLYIYIYISADKRSQPTLRSSSRSSVFERFKTMHALNCRVMGKDRILIHRHQEPTHSSSLGVQSVLLGHEQIQMEPVYLSRYSN